MLNSVLLLSICIKTSHQLHASKCVSILQLSISCSIHFRTDNEPSLYEQCLANCYFYYSLKITYLIKTVTSFIIHGDKIPQKNLSHLHKRRRRAAASRSLPQAAHLRTLDNVKSASRTPAINSIYTVTVLAEFLKKDWYRTKTKDYSTWLLQIPDWSHLSLVTMSGLLNLRGC